MSDDSIARFATRLYPVLPASVALPLHGAAASRLIEASAQAALPPFTLMSRAGHALARLALALAPHARRVAVLAGPGNNGGDGFMAAAVLRQAGMDVAVHDLGSNGTRPADARQALQQARQSGCRIDDALPQSLDADLSIDALLGLGTRRAPDGAIAAAIRLLQSSRQSRRTAVLAADLPSGLHPQTGCTMGRDVVVADHTLSLLTLKPGLLTGQGREHAGRLWFADLGVETDTHEPDAWLHAPEPGLGRDRREGHARHKGSFGDVVIVGGAPGMAGAALLAARAALLCGAGRVYLAPLDPAASRPDPQRPELMHRDASALGEPRALDGATVVAGCGGGSAIAAWLPSLLHRAPRVVLDADGLNSVAADPALAAALRRRSARGWPTILTPHPLEAARLLGIERAEVQSDRLASVERLVRAFGCTVLLKGSGTVIGSPGAVPRINASGNDRLATAGTGDVLAGWIGGLWSQHPDASPALVAAEAAGWHGQAAERAPGSGPLVAGDLLAAMSVDGSVGPTPMR